MFLLVLGIPFFFTRGGTPAWPRAFRTAFFPMGGSLAATDDVSALSLPISHSDVSSRELVMRAFFPPPPFLSGCTLFFQRYSSPFTLWWAVCVKPFRSACLPPCGQPMDRFARSCNPLSLRVSMDTAQRSPQNLTHSLSSLEEKCGEAFF